MLKKIYLVTIGFLLGLSSFAQKDSAKTYKMVVSFHSFASGVPSSQPLKDYIKKFKKANKIKCITADHIGPLGREGEYKLAFTLEELSKKQQQLFIARVKEVVAKMKERGNAELIENDTIATENMPSTATIVSEKF